MTGTGRLAAVIALVLAACAGARAAEAADRLAQALEARGIGADALGMIGNAVAYRALPEPPGAAGGVRRFLDDPAAVLGAADALDLPAAGPLPPAEWAPPDDLPEAARDAIAALVAATADLTVRVAAMVPGPCCERAALVEAVSSYGGAVALERLVREADLAAIDSAGAAAMGVRALVLKAFAGRARAELTEAFAGASARRFASPAGTVVIAPATDTVHQAPAAIVIDVGGDDTYRLERLGEEGTLVIVDLAGNDTYLGDDVAVRAARVTIDLAGDDVRESDGGGQAAAIGGVSVLHDGAGDDSYTARAFAQGAAVAGLAVLIDEGGSDRYRIGARGQGFGGPLGFGALVDRDGRDGYRAEGGLGDPYGEPGGALSFAQGAAAGLGGRLAGGVGLLRDQAGDDRYEAEKYAQGLGADRGLGVLDDQGGDDSYVATHYGQGFGVRAGVGLVRDRQGYDGYWLSEGAGQGAGQDHGLGALADDAGGDRYQARAFAQGASRGGGLGVLADGAGDDVYALDLPGDGWGRSRALPGLPALAFVLDAGGADALLLGGEPLLDRAPDALAGALAGRGPELGDIAAPACPAPADDPYAYQEGDPVGDWVGQAAPLFGHETGQGAATYARLWASLPASVPALLRAVSPDDPLRVANLEALLRCYLRGGDAAGAAEARGHLIETATAGGGSGAFALGVLAASPPGVAAARAAAAAVADAPDCATRAAAIALVDAAYARAPAENDAVADFALRAASDHCWRAAGAALDLWRAVRGESAPLPAAVAEMLPEFLGTAPRPKAASASRDVANGKRNDD